MVAGAAAAAVVGVLGLAAAMGLWTRRGWGWMAAIVATALVVAGTLVALATGARESMLILGLVLGLVGALATWLPSTRRACGG
jgi:uncharacterized membrane protein (DUF2068 family)